MSVENIILFDMDGTLTEPRQRIDMVTTNKVLSILANGHDVGIVTGSPEDYIHEQVGLLLDEVIEHPYWPEGPQLHLLPCNGTKYIVYDSLGLKKEIASNNMAANLGEESFINVMAALIDFQASETQTLVMSGQALTGNFIQYRGSMINWCPIGRNANQKERAAFVDFDNAVNFRNGIKDTIDMWLVTNGLSDQLTVALGGSTSFDIYPTGWDKTYALRWFPEQTCWFVGDKCQPGGNDQHLYDELNPAGRSFETKNPTETIEIIERILSTLSPDSSAG